jgi:hypothetical protein
LRSWPERLFRVGHPMVSLRGLLRPEKLYLPGNDSN